MPKYLQISQQLAARIQDGSLPAKTKLPSETELMAEFSSSRGTVRKAIDALLEKGFVRKQQGKGVFVLSQEAIEFQFNGIVSFSEAHQKMGQHEVETDVLSCDVIDATDELAQLFSVKKGTSITRIKRIRIIDGERVIFDINHFVTELVPGLTSAVASGSIYQNQARIRPLLNNQGEARVKVGDESPACFSGIFPLKEVKNLVDSQGLQIQNLPDKRAGNPDREDNRLFALRLQPLLGEVG